MDSVLGFGRKGKTEKQQQEEKIKEDEGGDLLVGFNLLPEECISTIFSFTSPLDVFRSSLVSTIFKSAAESNSVWESFLPSIYPEILSRSSSSSPSSSSSTSASLLGDARASGVSSKKELYCSLSEKPILIDGDFKSFGLEKWSGKVCFMLAARALSIIWGSTPQYWTWGPSSGSRFPEVAKLLKVCWMEIFGKVETRMLSPKTTYGAYFVIKTTTEEYGLDHVPGRFTVKVVGECNGERRVFLTRGRRMHQHQQQAGEFPRERGDGWMEIEMGEFYNDGEEDGEVEMHLLETSGHWKRGLIVQGMELRPKVST